MNTATITAVALLITVWSLLSGVLGRRNLTGPMIFVVVGYGLGNSDWGVLPVDATAESVQLIAEVTLALLLFSDASRVSLAELRRDAGLPTRLLAIGLPLTVVIGAATAFVVLTDLPWSLALFIGAALAPTDAALSAAVINDDRVPPRLRRSLNVESGLNDGVATPVVTVALALAAAELGLKAESETVAASAVALELLGGAAAGLAVGALGAVGLNGAVRRGWTAPGAQQMATLALAVTAFTLANAAEANGFIAAFIAGITFGAVIDRSEVDAERAVELPELGGELLALVVWFLFGAGLLPIVVGEIDVAMVAYAVLSLMLLRMVPVAVALIWSGIPRREVLFLGWFGPRGLASVVFALLAVERLAEAEEPLVGRAIATVGLTVLLSVVLHGVTAGPAGRRFGDTASGCEYSDAASVPQARTQQLGPPHPPGTGKDDGSGPLPPETRKDAP